MKQDIRSTVAEHVLAAAENSFPDIGEHCERRCGDSVILAQFTDVMTHQLTHSLSHSPTLFLALAFITRVSSNRSSQMSSQTETRQDLKAVFCISWSKNGRIFKRCMQ